jgi:conjugal transfer/entry exclusion protein
VRKLILMTWLLAVLLVSPAQQATAGGIPVFDGVGLGQSIMGYVQNIMDYAEQLNQLQQMEQQYTTQIQQYQRELEEYQHFLNQVQNLGPILSNADWQDVLQQTVTYYGNSPWASIPNVNITTSAGAANVQTIVETAYEMPAKASDTITGWQSRIPGYQMTDRETTAQDQNYTHMQRFMDRQLVMSKTQENMDDRSFAVDNYMDIATSLPSDSDLKTQQLIAQEMAFLLQQQEILIAQINQLVGSQETMSEFVASKDSASKELARGNIEKHKNNYLPALGNNQWKTL